MPFSLGQLDFESVLSAGLTTVAQGAGGKLSGRYNKFMEKMGSKLSPSRRLLGNPYAKKNAWHTRLNRPDPINSFDWIGVVLSANVSTATQMPWFYIDGITIPDTNVAADEQPWNGTARKTAGKFSVGGTTVKFYTGVDGLGPAYAHQWMRTVYRGDGFYSLPSLYKRDIQVFLLDPTRDIVIDFRLIGCFPTSTSSIELGGESGLVETTLSLSVDEMFVNYDSNLTAARDSIEGLFQNTLGKVTSGLGSAVSSGIRSFF